ncbi:MAG: tRNA threonylcarbamoyladenosine dehydratase [Firmicutes bacterium]|nr:tRNA threonylcarbamoyladenosine dehydratase [Bacillota bacterium]
MPDPHARTALLLGPLALDKLAAARVAVFGLGGVGGHAAEALTRGGVGALDLVDGDTVSESNLNRQIAALHSTLGRPKAEVMAERVRDINPACDATAYEIFFDANTAGQFDFARYDYVLDCIDTVTSKLLLIELCYAAGTNIISCMGAGNKLDPTRFEVADIYSTSVCPLAKAMRGELRKRGIPALKVVYSKEQPVVNSRPPGSVSFVPSAAGLVMAGEAIREISGFVVNTTKCFT